MAETADPNNASLQEMVSDPSVEDVEGEDPFAFDTCMPSINPEQDDKYWTFQLTL